MLLHQTLTELITSICMFGYSLCPNFKFPVILSNVIFLKTYVTSNVLQVLIFQKEKCFSVCSEWDQVRHSSNQLMKLRDLQSINTLQIRSCKKFHSLLSVYSLKNLHTSIILPQTALIQSSLYLHKVNHRKISGHSADGGKDKRKCKSGNSSDEATWTTSNRSIDSSSIEPFGIYRATWD